MNCVPDYCDIEVGTLAFMLDNGKWTAAEVARIRRQLEDRKAQILSGLHHPQALAWTLRVQTELDSRCRVRRDPIHGWMLDRLIDDPPCWHPVGYIGKDGRLATIELTDEHGNRVTATVVADDVVRPDLIPFLREHDMQRPGYFIEKAQKAAAVRFANEKLGTERVLAAVNSLSNKQVREFIEVEKAIQTGETVTMHGPCKAMFDRLTDAGKKAPPGPTSINPGQHPLRLQRDYSRGEGEMYGFRKMEDADANSTT